MIRIIQMPADVEAVTGVKALAVAARRIRIQFTVCLNASLRPLPCSTMGFDRHRAGFALSVLASTPKLTTDELYQLAEHCRVLAYNAGEPCARDIIR